MIRRKKSPIRKKPKSKSSLAFSFAHKTIPILIICVSMQISTQKCAKGVNYNSQIMGNPIMVIKNEPIYPFYSIGFGLLAGARRGNNVIGKIVYDCTKIIVIGTGLACIAYILLVFVRGQMSKEDEELYQKGKWCDFKDLKELGLLAECGVVLGQWTDGYVTGTQEKGGTSLTVKKTGTLIRYYTNVCAMLMCPSRSGKGVSTVVPSLLDYPASIITVDPKGENYEITAGWRSRFTYIYKYSPVTKNTLCFNVLDEISEENPFRDANIISTILTAPANPNSNADPHWTNTAKVLITATILHVKCSNYERKSLPGVYEYLASANADDKSADEKADMKKQLLKNMISAEHCTKEIHQAICNYASQILSAADEEMGSIYSSALEALAIFNDEKVAYCSDTSDFSLDDFKYSETPISWYLTIPFSDLDRLAPLLRLIIEFVCRKFSQGLTKFGNEVLKNRILFLIDEFPTLGKMDTIETFAGILNGYGISFLWICQTKAQIDKLYGQNAPILDHCKYTVTYAINDDNIAEYFSKRIGSEGIVKHNVSTSGSKYDFGLNSLNVSNDIGERRLFTSGEIETLPCEYELIYTQGGPTALAYKVAYYSDPRFKDKANLPKPETRKELLYECRNSFVIKDDDAKWWFHFDNSNTNIYEFMPEIDVTDILAETPEQKENEKNIEENENYLRQAGVIL